MVEDSGYKAESMLTSLPLARKRFNFELIEGGIKNRGDITKASEHFNISRSVLHRGLEERRVLSVFPEISKSKVSPLSTIKVNKEFTLFARYCNINKLSTRDLYKAVKEWRKRIENSPRLILSSLQHDLIIGSTLGDANIRQRDKNCSFRVAHSKVQKEYLLWKYNILKKFTLSRPYWTRKKSTGHLLEILEFSTATHYAFNYYRKLFYKNSTKRITQSILNLLNPRSLAIWLCDDGCYARKQGYIILCTNSYTFKEHKMMKDYFGDVWGLNPTIGFRDERYYYLRFKQDDTKKLVEIVRPFVPKLMKYKIGE